MSLNRRDFLRISSVGGLVFSSGLAGVRAMAETDSNREFYFVQLSDTHWGFNNPKFNADSEGTLPKAIDIVNGLSTQPDFVVFTGDLTHTTDDPALRRQRMKEFSQITARLKNKNVRYLPGEHDASLDGGEAYREFFGDLYYRFEHKGIQFICLDNVSDPRAFLGDNQLDWLRETLRAIDRDAPLVVLTHRPLFDLKPEWGWSTADGAKAIDMLLPYRNTTVFYGHIHQAHHHRTGHIAHHSARSLIFPLAPPATQGRKFKIAWNKNAPYAGLGLRDIGIAADGSAIELQELQVSGK